MVDIPKSEKPLAQRAVRGGFWVALSSYFNIGFGFIANLILTRILLAEDFGVFTLAFFFFSLFNLRPKLGTGYAFAQRKETSGELIGTFLGLDFLLGVGSIGLAVTAAPLLARLNYSQDVIQAILVLSIVGLIEPLTSTAWGLMDRELKMGKTSMISSLVFPLSYLPAFWLAVNGGGFWSLVAQNVAYAFLLLIGIWWTAKRELPHVWQVSWKFSTEMAGQLIRFGVLVGVASIAGIIVAQFDNYLIGTYVSEATLGYYDRAYRIAQWPALLITSVLTRATFYTYTRLQDDPVRLSKTVTMVLWLISAFALPISLAIFTTAPELISFLWGERWQPSAIFLRFLVVYSLIRPMLDNAGLLFVAVGKPRQTTISAFVQAGVMIAVATPLTFQFGAVGTAVGVGISFLVGLVVIYHFVRRTVTLSSKEIFIPPLIATATSLVVNSLWIQTLPLDRLTLGLNILVESLLTVLVFFAVMFLLQPRKQVQRLFYVWNLLVAKS